MDVICRCVSCKEYVSCVTGLNSSLQTEGRHVSQSVYNSHSRRVNRSNVRITNNELLRYYPLKKGQALVRVNTFKKSSNILMRVKDNGFIEYYRRSNNREITRLPRSIFKPTESRLTV